MPLLSVIIPVYNESATISQIIEKINSVDIDKEIIVVDDGSTDGTDRILRAVRYGNLKIIYHTTNRGKGSAVITGLSNAAGDYVIIQDADLECGPSDFVRLVEFIKQNNADMVFGVRSKSGYKGLFMQRLGNQFLTGVFNFLFNSRLNDYAACYKLARKETFDSLNLKAKGLDIEVEITAMALKKKIRILEAPVSYAPRTYSQGKKIRWKDGLWTAFYMLKYGVFR